MFTNKDIEYRSIFVINCIHERDLRVSNGELLLQDLEEDKTLTKMPFQKILALFIVGHIRITTPLIDKCKKFNVALIVVNQSFRPVFYWANSTEANYLLRQKQYAFQKDDISIAKILVKNKITNQIETLKKTRKTDPITKAAIDLCRDCMDKLLITNQYNSLMGIEGLSSKGYFEAYYQDLGWQSRKPRVKCDALNDTLDIGYTILFNYIECFVRMFGFDPYGTVDYKGMKVPVILCHADSHKLGLGSNHGDISSYFGLFGKDFYGFGYFFISHGGTLDHRRQTLVYQEGQNVRDKELDKSKRNIKDDQCLQKRLRLRTDRLVHSHDHFHGHIGARIEGIYDKIIGRNADKSRHDRTNQSTYGCTLKGMPLAVDQACRQHEACA